MANADAPRKRAFELAAPAPALANESQYTNEILAAALRGRHGA